MVGKKRLLLAAASLASIGAVVALATGVTFGLFSGQAISGNSTISSGTISVSNDAASVPCSVQNVVPGDTTPADSPNCTFTIDTASTVKTYAATDVFIATGKAASVTNTYGSTATVTPKDLYDGSNTTGLSFFISDGPNQYTVPVGPSDVVPCSLASTDPFKAASTTLASPSADTCYEIKNLILSSSTVAAGSSTLATLTTKWAFDPSAGNAYQGGDAVIALNAHEVQSAHNGFLTNDNTLAGTPCTVGAVCAGFAGSWS